MQLHAVTLKNMLYTTGKELLNDAALLHEAGLSQDQCVVNVMPVPVSNTYSSPDPATLQELEAASPALLLSSEVGILQHKHV